MFHKKIKLFLLLTFITTLAITESAQAQLSSVCPRIANLGFWQYKNNQVQRTGGVGTSVAGFLQSPTIIFVRSNPASLGSSVVYDRSGQQLCNTGPRLGCATRRGECLSRYKANCTTRSMRQTAVRRTRSAESFWKVAPNLCVRVPDIGRCYNVKVRGLCDGRTLG
jgi:hypothetical protein